LRSLHTVFQNQVHFHVTYDNTQGSHSSTVLPTPAISYPLGGGRVKGCEVTPLRFSILIHDVGQLTNVLNPAHNKDVNCLLLILRLS
jgi:hypothetical protein